MPGKQTKMKKHSWFRSGISLPVTRLDPVSPTTSSDVVLLDTSKNDVEMSEKKNVIVAELVAQAKELEKTLEEKMNLLNACHTVGKDLKTAHSSLQEQIIELERKLSGLRN
ncbi:hypothetical protein TB2_012454 [Malus domestica]